MEAGKQLITAWIRACSNPTLSWGTSTAAAGYEYCYDTTNNNTCDSGTWTTTSTATSVALSGLTPGAAYYWQVQARNAAGPTAASGGWWSFTVACPALSAPTLTSPANGAVGTATTPLLDWADVTGGDYL